MNKIVPVRVHERLQEIQYSLIQEWIINRGSQPLNLSHNSAMVFAPHQDDETFGCGGMIALKRQQEIPVHVVFITNGQSGVNDLASKDNTIQVRKQEAVKALEVLGVDNSYTHFLDKQDGALQKLTAEQKQLTIAQIVELLKLYQPTIDGTVMQVMRRSSKYTFRLGKACNLLLVEIVGIIFTLFLENLFNQGDSVSLLVMHLIPVNLNL